MIIIFDCFVLIKLNVIFKVGLVLFGCLKVFVDFECIVIWLWVEGYQISLDYFGVDLVFVNICGFFDSVCDESLDVIGEVIEVNGKVIVIGCFGVEFEVIEQVYLKVFVVIGLYQYEQVMDVVYMYLILFYNLYQDFVFESGLCFIFCYYVYLKILEGCNNCCSFCIILKFCGDFVLCLIYYVLIEVE